jgi:hypothetical protein
VHGEQAGIAQSGHRRCKLAQRVVKNSIRSVPVRHRQSSRAEPLSLRRLNVVEESLLEACVSGYRRSAGSMKDDNEHGGHPATLARFVQLAEFWSRRPSRCLENGNLERPVTSSEEKLSRPYSSRCGVSEGARVEIAEKHSDEFTT